MRLKNQVAIVTGAGAGIGRGIAERFGREGAKVVIAEIDPAAGNSASAAIREAGGEALFVATDVSGEAQVKNLVDRTLDRYAGSTSCATMPPFCCSDTKRPPTSSAMKLGIAPWP